MISLTEGTISLYVKFVGFPIWLSVIGFPHPPLRAQQGRTPLSALPTSPLHRRGVDPFPQGKADGYRGSLGKGEMGKG